MKARGDHAPRPGRAPGVEHDADAGPDSGFDEQTGTANQALPPLPPLWRGPRRSAFVALASSSLAQAALLVGAAMFGRALLDGQVALTGLQSLCVLVDRKSVV